MISPCSAAEHCNLQFARCDRIDCARLGLRAETASCLRQSTLAADAATAARMQTNFDIAIVGGGISGMSLAARLAGTRSVALLEPKSIWGPTRPAARRPFSSKRTVRPRSAR